MSRTIHQLIAGAALGDAITQYAQEIESHLNAEGHTSKLYAPEKHIHPQLKRKGVLPCRALPRILQPEDFLIYHYSIGSEATLSYRDSTCHRILCYHNITPPEFFAKLSSSQAQSLQDGRKILAGLPDHTELALGVSEYNAKDLRDAGFAKVETVPLIVTPRLTQIKPHPSFYHQWKDGLINWLFVGRVVPNKRFENLIKAFYYYHKTIQPASRLLLVGTTVGTERYLTFLKSLVHELGLQDAVHFTGHVTDNELVACYRSAHLYLCLSEHEGFGLPLIEAMHFNIPVIALDAAAVGETLGGAGVLLKQRNSRQVAELAHAILSKPERVTALVKRQHMRLPSFTPETLFKRLSDLFQGHFQVNLGE